MPAKKINMDTANYRPKAQRNNNAKYCGGCKFFMATTTNYRCAKVNGRIDPQFVCDKFTFRGEKAA